MTDKLASKVIKGINEVTLSPGASGAMSRSAEVGGGYPCKSCGLHLPKYPGRYPAHCPKCGAKYAESVIKENKLYDELYQEAETVLQDNPGISLEYFKDFMQQIYAGNLSDNDMKLVAQIYSEITGN